MGKRKFLLTLGLAALAVTALFLVMGKDRQATATSRAPRPDAQTLTHTVFLPALTRYYDPSYVSPFGIDMYGAVDDVSGLPQMQSAGSQWVTTMLHWSSIEPSQGSYDWSGFDAKAQNAKAAGMDLFVLFTGNPSWAATLPGGPVTDTQYLVNIVTLMAERYDCDGTNDAPGSPCVDYWSFYAEPDNGDLGRAQSGKGYWGHDGAGYAAMLSQVAPAIHGANARAQVLIGGLAYDYFEEDGGPFVRSFLADTLTALNGYPGGAAAYIDAVAFHFYPISADRWPTIREKAWEIQGIMSQHGVDDLPLMVPEMGYWSSPKFNSSPDGQARRLVQIYARALSVNMQPLCWYKVFDDAVPESDEDTAAGETSGLLDVDGYEKPSYYAYQTLTQELNAAAYDRELSESGVEGYVFTMPRGTDKTVLWSSAGTVHVEFPYSRLRLVNTTGNEFDIRDGETTSPGDLDGKVNGKITLEIYENQPFYVEQK